MKLIEAVLIFLLISRNEGKDEEHEDKICKVALDFVDYLSHWFVKDPKLLLDSVEKNRALGLGRFFEIIEQQRV